ncbi:TonB-dependent receptor [Catenovulum agarivorans DS-2]|uniref:TonB-dependent receptor n=1 Tax=Catenovulum agarivorans DS-2 TaxID=1328313 RepID=W7QJQ2_9ALTE|nr:TonB-dependent receptor [Catenovulum agarivorans]EWH09202.1 TonB-dependent receptor [Catenovulum agarivorans DS-2]
MKHNFKLTAVSAGILAACISLPAISAEETSKKAEESETEVIEVTGFRGSLIKSINAKRNSSGVLDSIHAEDVGKSTDQNIADALSRVTGISVQEEDGEGSRIAVRGTNANLNQISMNGVALTSGASGDIGNASSEQSVDLSTFSSDILSSIDVQKTASADQDEGSLGANVVLRTVRPLRLRNGRRTLNVEARHNQYNGETDERISGSYSDKFLDDRFGVIFTATTETMSTRQDQYDVNWSTRQDRTRILASNVTDAKTGLVYSDISDSDDIEADTELSPLTHNFGYYRLNMNKRERKTATLGLQFLPTDDTEVMLDLNYSNQVVNIDNNNIQVQQRANDNNNLITDPQAQWHTIDGNVLTRNLERHGRTKITRQLGGRDTENKVASLNISHFVTDNFKADIMLGYSNTEAETLPSAFVLLDTRAGTYKDTPLAEDLPDNAADNTVSLQPTGFDCTQGPICNFVMSDGYYDHFITSERDILGSSAGHANIRDPELFNLATTRLMSGESSDTNKSVFLDFDWTLDGDYIRSLEFGGKWSEREKFLTSENRVISLGSSLNDEFDEELEIDAEFNVNYEDLLTNQAFPVNDFMKGIVTDPTTYNYFKDGWGVVDPMLVFELMQSGEVVPLSELRFRKNPGASRDITQTNTALYTKLNFELDQGRLTGNIGLRYVKTKDTSRAFQSINYNGGTNAIDLHQIIGEQRLADGSLPICDYLYNDRLHSDAVSPDGVEQYGDLPAPGTCSDPYLFYEMDNGVDANGEEIADLTIQDITIAQNGQRYVDPALLVSDNERYKLQVAYGVDGYDILRNDPITSRAVADGSGVNFRIWSDRSTNSQTIQANGMRDPQAQSRFFRASAQNESTVLLPSLSLNYAISRDLIGRLGLSKTMARPRFDDMRPSGVLREDIFASVSTGDVLNPYLKPLESKNLDLSLEWYFSDTGLLSGALFYKDMTGFVQNINKNYYIRDIRNDRLEYETDENGEINLDSTRIPGVASIESILIDPDTGAVPGDEHNCMPVRNAVNNMDANPVDVSCAKYLVNTVVNGTGSVTKGLEFAYTQNYDFLPGLLSGLGVNFNYTYSHSENEAIVDEDGEVFDPYPQPFTPRHSANLTVFWEQDGLMLRLADRYNSEQLVDELAFNGFASTWLDATNRLDFSSSYRINRNLTVTFQATNITDDDRTVFMTSRRYTDINGNLWNEGNFFDNPVSKNKVVSKSKSGRTFRLGIRASF